MKIQKKSISKDIFSNNLWITIVGIISAVHITKGSGDEFTTLIRVICATLSIVIGVIVTYKIPNVENDFVKYIGIGFFYLGIISFVDVFLTYQSINNYDKRIVSITTYYFEFLVVIYPIIFTKNKISIFSTNLIFLISLMILSIASNLIIIKSNDLLFHYRYTYDSILVVLITSLIFILMLWKDEKINYEKDKKWLMKIMFFFSLYKILVHIDFIAGIDLDYIQKIARLIAYILTFKYMEDKLLNNSYQYTKEKLVEIRTTKTAMYNSLRSKERLLKEAKMNLKKSEHRYEEIIESISDGILTFENNVLMYINESGVEQIFHKISGDFEQINLDYILYKLTNGDITEEEVEKGFRREFVIENKENNKMFISLILKNTNNTEKILLIRNLTGVNELQELRKKRNKVKIMEKIKEEFYANISHELRTPINVVSSALQLNNLMLENNKLEDMVKNNVIIRENCLRLIRTVNNFIDTNRISEGFLEPNKKVYNIVNVVESVVLACNKYMILTDTQLVFDTSLEEIYLCCDIDHIERVMLNILSNSLKHGKFGGNINVVIETNENYVNISVSNDAEPIPKEMREIIFEKFGKGDTSLTRQSEGSGLGLYISKKLVELNGGTINIDSSKEGGNVFNIRFPFNFSGEQWEVDFESDEHNILEKVNIEFSDIYFN